MSYEALISNLGFMGDPFGTTNADDEEKLDSYFVPPPFFAAVLGDYRKPNASIVFAPRGGGKTALKRKIELDSQSGKYLCITYNNFDVTGLTLADITAAYHLKNIVELALTGVLISVNHINIDNLSAGDRHFLYILVKEYFSKIDRDRLRSDIASIKSTTDKIEDVWNRFTGPIGILINAVLAKFGIKETDIKKFESEAGQIGTMKEQLGLLLGIAATLGFQSVYILIDKVDENPLTANDAGKSYAFIRPLIVDLQLLETKQLAVKCFLWSLVSSQYKPEGRPDRIKTYNLEWQHSKIEEMLSERLRAFSEGRITRLADFIDGIYSMPIDRLVAITAQGSPRNMVRICKAIIDEQSNIDVEVRRVSVQAVNEGLGKIAVEICEGQYPTNTIRDLQRVGRCDFTIANIANDIFKISTGAAITKIGAWERSGAVLKVGEIKTNRLNRPSNLYAIDNVLLAKHTFATLSVEEFAAKKIRICSNCGRPLIRDWDRQPDHRCQGCQADNKA